MLQSSYSDNKEGLINKAEKLVGESMAINEQFDDNHIALGGNVETFG